MQFENLHPLSEGTAAGCLKWPQVCNLRKACTHFQAIRITPVVVQPAVVEPVAAAAVPAVTEPVAAPVVAEPAQPAAPVAPEGPVVGPAVRPVVLGQDDVPPAPPKRGWWRR